MLFSFNYVITNKLNGMNKTNIWALINNTYKKREEIFI